MTDRVSASGDFAYTLPIGNENVVVRKWRHTPGTYAWNDQSSQVTTLFCGGEECTEDVHRRQTLQVTTLNCFEVGARNPDGPSGARHPARVMRIVLSSRRIVE